MGDSCSLTLTLTLTLTHLNPNPNPNPNANQVGDSCSLFGVPRVEEEHFGGTRRGAPTTIELIPEHSPTNEREWADRLHKTGHPTPIPSPIPTPIHNAIPNPIPDRTPNPIPTPYPYPSPDIHVVYDHPYP